MKNVLSLAVVSAMVFGFAGTAAGCRGRPDARKPG